jgi:hypothetical protein
MYISTAVLNMAAEKVEVTGNDVTLKVITFE